MAIGNYDSTSIASRPVRLIPSSKRRGTGASEAPGAPMAPNPMQARMNNILQSRMDGTFDAKVAAANAHPDNVKAGLQMNAAGQLVPKAAAPSPLPAASPTGTTPQAGVTPPPAAPSPMKPPANLPPMQRPVMMDNPGWSVTGQPKQVRAPATFDGKPKAQFFGEAMAKNGPTAGVSVYQETPVKASAAAAGQPRVTAPSPMASRVTSPVTPPSVTPASRGVTAPSPARTPKPWKAPVFAKLGPAPGLPANTQEFQTQMKALHQGQKLAKPPGVPAVTPKPGSSAPQPFSAAALGTGKPRAVMPPTFAMGR